MNELPGHAGEGPSPRSAQASTHTLIFFIISQFQELACQRILPLDCGVVDVEDASYWALPFLFLDSGKSHPFERCPFHSDRCYGGHIFLESFCLKIQTKGGRAASSFRSKLDHGLNFRRYGHLSRISVLYCVFSSYHIVELASQISVLLSSQLSTQACRSIHQVGSGLRIHEKDHSRP